VLLVCPVSFFPGPLFEYDLQVNGGLLQHLLLDVGVMATSGSMSLSVRPPAQIIRQKDLLFVFIDAPDFISLYA
jgi:hypothetical protein